MSTQLKFREDGSFKILQFTDLHIGEGAEKDEKTIALMKRLIAEEKPDLIVHTGDHIWSHVSEDPIPSFRLAISPAVESGIPFASIFGNHDAEVNVTRQQLLDILLEHETCLTQPGPEDISGLGNFLLTVHGSKDEDEKLAMYFLDSGIEAAKEIGGYEWIHTDQVAWYLSASRHMTKKHEAPLPSLAFFHIPIPEYETSLIRGRAVGHKFEKVCCPDLNSGLFLAMLDQGDVFATFCGHDHDNDFIGWLHGIQLCYGRVTGYNTYGRLQRGARIIELQEGSREFKTYLHLDDGTIVN
ncbi:phosphohydrolase [Paenibacillus sp. HMSSN-139]|nr:phosphohydrolase [Paenibacillus sp. HMSSN-139]